MNGVEKSAFIPRVRSYCSRYKKLCETREFCSRTMVGLFLPLLLSLLLSLSLSFSLSLFLSFALCASMRENRKIRMASAGKMAVAGTLCQFLERLNFLEEAPRPDERKRRNGETATDTGERGRARLRGASIIHATTALSGA